MAALKPIVIDSGQLKQVPDSQGLDVGGWELPADGGTSTYIIQADGSGNGVWVAYDHGTLAGLAGDDHTQYHTDARGDARYYTETELDAGQLDNRYFTEAEHLNSSAGAGDSGKPIKLDAGGHLDATMLNDGDIDHGSIGGLAGDDHTGYHTDARAATWLAANHETTYNHANYDTAYGWGDHASGGYLKADGSVPLTAHWAAGAYNITGLASLAATGTVVGSNIPSPTVDDQVLISTASGVASWSTAGASQVLQSDENGEVLWSTAGWRDDGRDDGGYDPNPGDEPGMVWTDLGQQASELRIASLANVGGGIVLAGTTPNAHILRSIDFGATWTDLGQQASEIWVASIAYCGDGVAVAGTKNTGKIFRSTDHGVTWGDLGQLGSEQTIFALAYLGNDIVIAGTGPLGHIFRSDDAGATWSDLGQQFSQGGIYCFTNLGNGVALAGTGNNGYILHSDDYGATWDNDTDDLPGSESIIYSLQYLQNGIVLAGTYPNGRILRSIDSGTTWTVSAQLFSQQEIRSIAYMGSGVAVAGTGTGGKILHSSDYGANWVDLGQQATQTRIDCLLYLGFSTTLAGTYKASGGGHILRSGGAYAPSEPPSNQYEVHVATGDGTTEWTKNLIGLEIVTVDNITINGAVITSDTDAISFDDENLTTTGWLSAKNLPRPTADDQVLISTAADTAAWSTAGNDEVLRSDSSGEVAWTAIDWPVLLTANETIYVTKAGNDSTGDGSVGSPYLTVGRSLTHIGRIIPGAYSIEVDIGEGSFAESKLSFNYPYGNQVQFSGQYEDHSTLAAGNYTGITAGPAGLDYYDFDFTLPVDKTATVGDFCLVRSAVNGTYPHLTRGCHEIVGWNAGTRVITVRCYVSRDNGGHLAASNGGDVTCDITVIKTVLTFTSHGIYIQGNIAGGSWNGLVLKGDATTDFGIWCENGASIVLGNLSGGALDRAGSSGWLYHLFGITNSVFYVKNAYFSFSISHCWYIAIGCTVQGETSCMTGVATRGIYSTHSVIYAVNMDMYSATQYGVYAFRSGFVDMQNAEVKEGAAAGSIAFYAAYGSGIKASGAAVAGYATTKSPAANPGNTEAYIQGP